MASTMRTSQQSFVVHPLPSLSKCRCNSSTLASLRFQKKARWSWPLQVNQSAVRSSIYPAFASALPEGATERDAEYMRLCIELARKAVGFTSPNPMVGCIIVKDGNIIGRGFHPMAGKPHAEVFALREAGANAEGSTAYVSLEPCNHYGRTPPCTNALIKAGVNQVVVGMLDPNPIVAGKGVETLTKAGIKVIAGIETSSCQALNEAYVHRMLKKKPFATLRFSMSLDGRFLECDPSDCKEGSYFSKLLQENDAIIVLGSALLNNPVLHSAEPGSKQPLRIVLTNDFQLSLQSSVFDTTCAPTLVIASEQAVMVDLDKSSRKGVPSMESLLHERGVDVMVLQELDLHSVLDVCYERGFCSVLFDSRGQDVNGIKNPLGRQAMEEKVLHKVVVDVFPFLGGETEVGPSFILDKDILPLERISSRMSGSHVIIEGYFPK